MSTLSGLNWDTSSSSQPPSSQSQSLRPSPSTSARSPSPFAPQSNNTTGSAGKAQAAGSAQGFDSFSSLLGPGTNKNAASLSLQERQKQLLAEKAKQTPNAQAKDPYGSSDASFWEGLGSGRGTPNVPTTATPAPLDEDEDDILAAFNSAAPVDNSSHFPPPTKAGRAAAAGGLVQAQASTTFDDDDDPFGLGTMSTARAPAAAASPSAGKFSASAEDEDDILGMLGKPVDEVRRSRPPPTSERKPASVDRGSFQPGSSDPRDRAIAELVDMGFPVDKSGEALAHTDTGYNVQAAVGWLLNQAHEQSRSKSQPQSQSRGPQSRDTSRHMQHDRQSRGDALPSWMKGTGQPSREDSSSPGSRERDIGQYASQIGNNLFKSANTLWKSGQKHVQKAMADFQQQEGDSSVPRWMREAQSREDAERRQARAEESQITNEAAMLDRAPPGREQHEPAGRRPQQQDAFPPNLSARESPFTSATPSQPRPRDRESNDAPRPTSRLTRQQVEEQTSQAYVSSARRRKPQVPAPASSQAKAQPVQSKTAQPEMDIFNEVSMSVPSSRPSASSASNTGRTSAPIAVRSKASARPIPSTSPSALSSSNSHRQRGTDAFKRGDYGAAQNHYTDALGPLPDKHPIVIVLRCNRALTNIKTGEPRAAIADAEAVLALIGPAHGEGESIDLGQEGEKPMKDYFGKALMRKAEAFEHLEKWSDAAGVWREAVEAGVGGAVSIQGRNRCEKALAPKPTPRTSAPKKPAAAAPPRRSAAADLGPASGDSEAVKRLREANAAASAASDEQFALTDAVDAKINNWRGTKKDNLRALLASLDTVLWADAGWKKVGMGDLVMANKVKIIYMKAIAKVHPDKISQTATTEQKMVSAAVFSTLNEAWDKFKTENGL